MTNTDLNELLAPLRRVEPVRRRARPHRRRATLPIAASALLIAGSAASYQAYRSTIPQTARATRVVLPHPIACLVGGRAAHAQDLIRQAGYAVSWRLETYASATAGYSSTPKTVPGSYLVEDITPQGSNTMIVFVRSPKAKNAPPIISRC
jgi:hypothetical protein